ncbi:MAG: SMI1/KNR4 family protein [Bacteroidota bacterium]
MAFWDKLFGKERGNDPEKKEENQNEMNPVVQKYISGLRDAYFRNDGVEEWKHFEAVIHGAEKESLDKIRNFHPEIPSALIDLLGYVDGTYWRKYKEEKITFFLLGSDVDEYPYYLLSSKEIIENRNNAKEYFSDYIDGKYDGIDIDEKITNKSDSINWLHFSDCMNNGGTSSLFIDFSPSKKGEIGQVVRFLHDPDEFKVIAQSFEHYLNFLIDTGFNFINEETVE